MTDVCLEVKDLVVGLLTLLLGTLSNWPCCARLTGPLTYMPGLNRCMSLKPANSTACALLLVRVLIAIIYVYLL